MFNLTIFGSRSSIEYVRHQYPARRQSEKPVGDLHCTGGLGGALGLKQHTRRPARNFIGADKGLAGVAIGIRYRLTPRITDRQDNSEARWQRLSSPMMLLLTSLRYKPLLRISASSWVKPCFRLRMKSI